MTRFGKMMLLASACDLLLTTAAFAQTAQPASPGGPSNTVPAAGAAERSDVGLEGIVVTATRRAVNLQNVPAVVTALPATTLKAFNVTGVLQLPTLASGLVIVPSGGNNIYLRGIGSASSGYNEAQVAVYVDGLYLANPSMGIYSFNNIDQIEVLKGPQGTLYGRNVTGGLIGVTTHNPGKDLKLDASVGYANYNTFSANVYASLPITDTLAANFALFHQKHADGWSKNLFTGQDEQKSDETGIETKVQWTPTSSTKMTVGFIYDYNNRDYGYAYEVAPGSVFPSGTNSIGADGTTYQGKYRDVSRIDPSSPFHAYIGTFKIEQDIGFAKLMSLTGYQTSNTHLFFAGGLPVLGEPVAGQSGSYDPFFEQNKTWSQEFQLTSKPSASRFEWLAGAFYYNDRQELQLDSYNTCIGNVCAPGAPPTQNTGYPTTKSYSGYADGTYRFFSATKLTVGLRYTSETKGLSGLVVPLPGHSNSIAAFPSTCSFTTIIVGCTTTQVGQKSTSAPTGIASSLHFDKLTYRFVLAQDLGANVHAYASHNLGFKSGAYNGNLFTNPPARPEQLYDTEVGVKSELFDHKLRLNAAYFHYTYKDVQVRSQYGAPVGNAFLENAARELMNGVDVDFSFTPVRGLVFTGSAEYNHAIYTSFPGASCTSPKMVNGVVVAGVTSVPCSLAGYKVQQAPPFSATVGVSYSIEKPSGTYTASANNSYTARTPLIQDDAAYNPRHDLVDLSLNWTAPNKRYDINLFVRNLTKAYYFAAFSESSSYAVVPGAPRTFGGSIAAHY